MGWSRDELSRNEHLYPTGISDLVLYAFFPHEKTLPFSRNKSRRRTDHPCCQDSDNPKQQGGISPPDLGPQPMEVLKKPAARCTLCSRIGAKPDKSESSWQGWSLGVPANGDEKSQRQVESFGARRPDYWRGFYLIKTNEQLTVACVDRGTALPDYTL